jgi:hypothetical protein
MKRGKYANYSLYDSYKQKVNSLNTSKENTSDLCEYLFKLVPYIKEYKDPSKRGTLYEKYMKEVEDVDINTHKQKRPRCAHATTDDGTATATEDHFSICNVCGDVTDWVVIVVDATRVCTLCGAAFGYQREDADGVVGYKEEHEQRVTKEIRPASRYTYTRMNHFTKWLDRLEKEANMAIPLDVLNVVNAAFTKLRPSVIKPVHIRAILKQAGMSKSYYLVNALMASCVPKSSPIKFGWRLKSSLIRRFDEVQAPFEAVKTVKNRSSFLAYNYTMYRFLQLEKRSDLLVYFPLLKSTSKMFDLDTMWCQMCQVLKWEYIK